MTEGSDYPRPNTLALGSPTALSRNTRWKIFLYISTLIVLLGFGSPAQPLIDLPISFFLKNKLHLRAHELAGFRLISAMPLYLSIAFGFARDVWNPFGMRDRGFFVVFGSISAALYIFFAFLPPNQWSLLAAVVMLTTSVLFVSAAQTGLTGAIGQQHVMSGQVSAAWNIMTFVPQLVAYALGGILSDLLEGRDADTAARIIFLVGAAIMAFIALYGFWRPRAIFNNLHEPAKKPSPLADIKRLLAYWPVYPALLIWGLFQFSPGQTTPLQYYLQNTLHAKDAEFGQWNTIFLASMIPTFALFGILCRRFTLRPLLFWGTIVGIPQLIPLLLIHSVGGAFVVAVVMGLMGGVAQASYMDLLIRSCPEGLEGTVLMMGVAMLAVATRFGDLLGTNLYDHLGGFVPCVIATTIAYALILPVLLFVPRHLTNSSDGVTLNGGSTKM